VRATIPKMQRTERAHCNLLVCGMECSTTSLPKTKSEEDGERRGIQETVGDINCNCNQLSVVVAVNWVKRFYKYRQKTQLVTPLWEGYKLYARQSKREWEQCQMLFDCIPIDKDKEESEHRNPRVIVVS